MAKSVGRKCTLVEKKKGQYKVGMQRARTNPEPDAADANALTYADHTMAAIHETIGDLASLGLVEANTIKEFDQACLTQGQAFAPEQLKALREREQASQAVLARYLGVSVNTVSQWERGERRATGTAATLLNLVEKHGLAYIR